MGTGERVLGAGDRAATVVVIGAGQAGLSAGHHLRRRGYGLVGLGERVAQSGGTLEVNRRPEANSFEVTAVLPWRTTASAS